MDKKWLDDMNSKYDSMIKEAKERIVNGIKENEFISEVESDKLISDISKSLSGLYLKYFDLTDTREKMTYREWTQWIDSLDLENYTYLIQAKEILPSYLDSEPKEFDGDIIITDPCYVMKKADESGKPKWSDFHPYGSIYEYPDYDEKTRSSKMFDENSKRCREATNKWNISHPSDWGICEHGRKMENLGIYNYMTRDTIYGDWSCTTYNSDTGKPIGQFCADAGLVSVMLLDEVLEYNPEFDYHMNKEWTTTWIKDFKGTVQFIVVYTEGVYEDDFDYHKKGEKWHDYSVEVIGHGVNKVTGEPINFVGKQTGL